MHKAVDEMGHAETFHGYAPDLGYEFLRSAMAKNDYQDKGCDIQADEIFISDGAKCDSGNIQEIFAADSKIAVCDPVYPVYVDTNVMAGRTGTYDAKTETWSNVIYMPCTKKQTLHRYCRKRHRTSFICVSRITRQDPQSQKHSFRSG